MFRVRVDNIDSRQNMAQIGKSIIRTRAQLHKEATEIEVDDGTGQSLHSQEEDDVIESQDFQARYESLIVQNEALMKALNIFAGETARPRESVTRNMEVPILPEPKDVDLTKFVSWQEDMLDYAELFAINESRDKVKIQSFVRSGLNAEWKALIRNGALSCFQEKESVEDLIGVLHNFIKGRDPEVKRMCDIFSMVQKEDQNAEDFLVQLKNGIYHAGFTEMESRRLLTILFYKGTNSSIIQSKIVGKKSSCVQFEELLIIARQYSQPRNLQNTSEGVAAVKFRSAKHGQKQKALSCKNCPWNHKVGDCPAKFISCFRCNKRGHVMSKCQNNVSAIESNDSSEEEIKNESKQYYHGPSIDSLFVATISKRPRCFVQVRPFNSSEQYKRIYFLVDSGSDITAVNKEGLETLMGMEGFVVKKVMSPPPSQADGSVLSCLGCIEATLQVGQKKIRSTIRLLPSLGSNILGIEEALALNLITVNNILIKEEFLNSKATQNMLVMNNKENKELDFILKQYEDVFDKEGELKPMKGPPMKIVLEENAVPSRRFKPYSIPVSYQKSVKDELDAMESKGIIERTPLGEPISWCTSIIVVPKKGTMEPRITVDLRNLNKYIKRPAHPTAIPKEVVSRIPKGMQYFSTLDSRSGYWQVPLDKESRHLTTFITQFGTYRFCRNVMGLSSASDEHDRRTSAAIDKLSNVEKVAEDVIVFSKTYEEHMLHLKRVLICYEEAGITLNRKKCHFAKDEVEFCGYIVNKKGYTISNKLVKALVNFPTPKSKTDVRSFLGIVNQFEAFSNKIADKSAPLRGLIGKNVKFLWTELHDTAFKDLVKHLSNKPTLAQFDPGAEHRLETDAAQTKGLGYVLWQRSVGDKWRLLQCGSRALASAETRYSATEIEALAVLWALKKCRYFLHGIYFELIVDHKALVPLLNSKYLDEIPNPRIQRIIEKIAGYTFLAIWRSGKEHLVADAFSRNPVDVPDKDDIQLCEELCYAVSEEAMYQENFANPFINDKLIKQISHWSESDGVLKKLSENIINGFPEHKEHLDEELRPFWKVRHMLSVRGSLLMYGARMVIPKEQRRFMLTELHKSHLGLERSMRRVRDTIYWPGIERDVQNIINSCESCAELMASKNKQTQFLKSVSTYPYEMVHVDIFTLAQHDYLVAVDNYSSWITIAWTPRAHAFTTRKVTGHLATWFSTYGIPKLLVTDGGPQFASEEFKQFCEGWHIQHNKSSPYNPQSNGKAEAAVKCMKRLLLKNNKNGNMDNAMFKASLLEYRNTPNATGKSPAQILFGRPTRSFVPHPYHFSQVQEDGKKIVQQHQDFTKGQEVRIQHPLTKRWDTVGTVVGPHGNRNSYHILTRTGKEIWRNAKFLKLNRLTDEVLAMSRAGYRKIWSPYIVRFLDEIKKMAAMIKSRNLVQGGL